jgi:hypothetical protein
MSVTDRLFVALATDPYLWFKSGRKRWELRKNEGQFTEKFVRPGRKVELRLGYRHPERALWGRILNVVQAKSIEEFFDEVPYEDVIPTARDQIDAILTAKTILRLDSNKPKSVLGFKVDLK